MTGRDHDRHTVAVTYRTARMAKAAAEKWPTYGWTTFTTQDPKTILVQTYKPESLFGPPDAEPLTKNPGPDAPYALRTQWEDGVVSWRFDCGCTAVRLDSDYRATGIRTTIPCLLDGGPWRDIEATIERIEWPCRLQAKTARLCITLPNEDGWRGRAVYVEESWAHALLAGVSSADRQHYIETGEIAPITGA